MRARVQLNDGDSLSWFNIVFAAVIIVVRQRFAEDPLIVSDLVYLDDAPKDEDGMPREEGTLEMVPRAVWGVLYPDDAGGCRYRLVGLPGWWTLQLSHVRNSD